jgi:hypothetical protein
MVTECQQVLDAKSPEELFGTHEKRSKNVYRHLARHTHPDMFTTPAEKKDAERAFVRLGELWALYQTKNGSATPSAAAANTVKTKRHTYTLGDKVYSDDVFAHYEATYDAGHETARLLIVKSPNDADLGNNHAAALKKLSGVPDEFKDFFPDLIETFRYRQPNGTDHFAVAQKIPEGFVPFTRILEVYPKGVDARDLSWIFRRMLIAVGNAHDVGLIHGAPDLNAFYIKPDVHGVILNNWQYSVETGKTLSAIPTAIHDDYPQSVFDKKPVDYALDIRLIAKAAERLFGPDTPRQFKSFMNGCMMAKTPEARYLLGEFEEMLVRLYGPPVFHKFTLEP